jgi:hypothetical protein
VKPRQVLGLTRVAVGVTAWLAPALATRTFGLGPIASDANGAVVTRLFAARDLVLGGAVLAARDPAALTRALELGLVADVADLATAVVSLREGGNRVGALVVGGGAAALAVIGTALLFATNRA